MEAQPQNIAPKSTKATLPLSGMDGRGLRKLREELGLSQSQLAELIGVSKNRINQSEFQNYGVAADVVSAVLALKRDRDAGKISLPPRSRAKDWRDNKKFAQPPVFYSRPPCPCGIASCVLLPWKDGDWPIHGHLWCFIGSRCKRVGYVNSQGDLVKPIRKNSKPGRPDLVCSGCRRRMEMSTKRSSNLGCDVITFRCRPKPEDTRGHDEPQRFRSENGDLRPLTRDELAKLHGRNRRAFPLPKCENNGCRRFGKTMERSGVIRLRLKNGARCAIAAYRCRSERPHRSYRVLPAGEVAERVGFGRYRWIGKNSQLNETVNASRPIRADREMPRALCPEHQVDLEQYAGPWKISGGFRMWRANCPVGNESRYVRADGRVSEVKGSRWKPGKHPGGAKPKKAALFADAMKLRTEQRLSWSRIAERLTPKEFSADPRRAAEAIRIAVRRLRMRT